MKIIIDKPCVIEVEDLSVIKHIWLDDEHGEVKVQSNEEKPKDENRGHPSERIPKQVLKCHKARLINRLRRDLKEFTEFIPEYLSGEKTSVQQENK